VTVWFGLTGGPEVGEPLPLTMPIIAVRVEKIEMLYFMVTLEKKG
jgi:hypothetical protein